MKRHQNQSGLKQYFQIAKKVQTEQVASDITVTQASSSDSQCIQLPSLISSSFAISSTWGTRTELAGSSSMIEDFQRDEEEFENFEEDEEERSDSFEGEGDEERSDLSEGEDEEERSDSSAGEGNEERSDSPEGEDEEEWSDSSEGEGEDDGMVHESDSFHSRGGLSSMTKEDKITQKKNSIESRKKVFAEDKVIRKQSSIKSGQMKIVFDR